MHEIDRDTAVYKFAYRQLDNRVVGIWIVVAYPGFEQVAENVQGLGLGSICLLKPNKLFADVGPLSLEMQIGNKQRSHCCYSNVYRDIFSMTIGIRGTSEANDPCGPVCTLTIVSTISIP